MAVRSVQSNPISLSAQNEHIQSIPCLWHQQSILLTPSLRRAWVENHIPRSSGWRQLLLVSTRLLWHGRKPGKRCTRFCESTPQHPRQRSRLPTVDLQSITTRIPPPWNATVLGTSLKSMKPTLRYLTRLQGHAMIYHSPHWQRAALGTRHQQQAQTRSSGSPRDGKQISAGSEELTRQAISPQSLP